MGNMEKLLNLITDPEGTIESMEREEKKAERQRLRDHFAGLAMQGIVSAIQAYQTFAGADSIASSAYRIADAMLAEREKGK